MRTASSHIDTDAAFRSGRPRIAGTRLAVADVVVMHLRLGMAPAEIAGRYDVPLAAVHAALAHYFDHREDIDRDIEEDAAYAEAFRRANPSPLQERLAALGG